MLVEEVADSIAVDHLQVQDLQEVAIDNRITLYFSQTTSTHYEKIINRNFSIR